MVSALCRCDHQGDIAPDITGIRGYSHMSPVEYEYRPGWGPPGNHPVRWVHFRGRSANALDSKLRGARIYALRYR